MAQTLTRWQPFSELAELRSRFDRMFADLTDGATTRWTPAVDIVRRNGELCIRAEVPGVRPDEVQIEVANDVLTISGEHREEREVEEEQYLRRERRFGAFSRSIALPSGIDPSSIKAKSHDGLLEIRVPLPRAPERTRVRIVPEAA